MAIEFKCPGCGKSYRVDDEFAGRRGKCRQCGAATAVPAAATAAAPSNGMPRKADANQARSAETVSRPTPVQKPTVKPAFKPAVANPAAPVSPARPVSPNGKPPASTPAVAASSRSVPMAPMHASDSAAQSRVVPIPSNSLPLPSLKTASSRPAVSAPAASREPNPEDDEDLYTLAPERKLPEKGHRPTPRRIPPASSSTGPAAAIASAAAPPIAILGYARSRPGPQQEGEARYDIGDVFEGNKFKNLYVPLVLILGCTAFQFAAELYFKRTAASGLQQAAIYLSAKLVVSVPVMLLACLLAVKLLDTSFGPVGPAILKISAIALTPGAIADAVMLITLALSSHSANPTAALVDLGFGGLIALILSLIAYFALFMYLFDLEFSEARTMIILVWVIRFIALLMLGFMFSSAGR
jgi:hypothetical protein